MTFPLPDLPVELPEPIHLLQGIIPDRILQTLMPRLGSYAARITVKTHAFGTVPASTLQAKLITSSLSPEDELHEYYALMRNGDPEGFLTIHQTPEEISCEICRMCAAAVDIYLDGALKVSMAETTGAGPVWPGYTMFEIPEK